MKVGTAQQIKAKHGSCHELIVRLRPETEEVLSSMTGQWAGALDANCIAKALESDSWKRCKSLDFEVYFLCFYFIYTYITYIYIMSQIVQVLQRCFGLFWKHLCGRQGGVRAPTVHCKSLKAFNATCSLRRSIDSKLDNVNFLLGPTSSGAERCRRSFGLRGVVPTTGRAVEIPFEIQFFSFNSFHS